jgi:hypothetical protein
MKRFRSCRNHSPPVVARLFLILASVLLTQGTGRADGITIVGTTQGAFDSPAVECGPVVIGYLTYTCGGFNVTTDGLGEAELRSETDNLGTFTLDPGSWVYSGHVFELLVSILEPPSGSESTTLRLGLFVEADNGAARISSGVMEFTTPTGTFLLEVDPLRLTPNQTAPLTGFISGATFQSVPESFDLAVVGFGVLATVIGRIRRRAA